MATINMKRQRFQTGLGCALTLSFSLCAASAGERGDTISAEEKQQAFLTLKSDAEAGDARSQYLLSTLYRTGRGIAQDAYPTDHNQGAVISNALAYPKKTQRKTLGKGDAANLAGRLDFTHEYCRRITA